MILRIPYIEQKILPTDPFDTIDQAGVGKLMQMAVTAAQKVRPDIKLGICGEHGGEPESVKFCHRIGLNYVSCSPFWVPSLFWFSAENELAVAFWHSETGLWYNATYQRSGGTYFAGLGASCRRM